MKSIRMIPLFYVLALFLGCTSDQPGVATEPGQEAGDHDSALATASRWVGRWNGPEGTYLQIAVGSDAYEITIKDLDRARIFQGELMGDHIEFQRDGTKEFLRPSSGEATGMKWLAGKVDCLTIRWGEGYCRD